MTRPRSAIPELGNQPPSVDFIENRLPKYSQAFNDPNIRFDVASQQFVSEYVTNGPNEAFRERPEPNAVQINDNLPAVSPVDDSSLMVSKPSTRTEEMEYWDEIFPDAITKFQKTTPPKIKKVELQIRDDTSWQGISLKLEKARSDYLNQSGQLGQAFRWGADHATKGNNIVKIAQGVAPSNPYSSPVLGAIQFILNAMQTSADARTQVLGAFDNLPEIFSETESLLSSFLESQTVRNAAIDLTVAVLCAVENTIAFFSTSRGKRLAKSVFEGSEYIKDLKESFKSIEDKITTLQTKSSTANYAASRQPQLAREKEKNVHLHAEIEILRSRSPSPNALILVQQQDDISKTYLDEKELQELLDVENTDVDLRFINQRKAHLPAEELSRAEQLVNDRKFRAWFMSLQSEKLLILWNQSQPKTHAGISPISAFCASLEPMFNSHDRFICVTWFCGLHSKHGNDEARAMLASLISQLCQQHCFDFGREYADTDKRLIRERDPRELFTLLYRLISSLPRDITLVILVDEAYIYERDGFQDELSIFNELLELVNEAATQSVIKLLFTSTRKVTFLNEAFKQGGLTLHVENAAHQRGGHLKDA
ncbi:hypothetical protein TrVFT333_008926 [Trichoderma virens FT-333]|nr:hypothetical protein TrVFT333_008926 [Trichoderma virens FT-333]